MADEHIRGLHQEFELLKNVEFRKNELIQELLDQVDKFKTEYDRSTLDHAREIQFNRDNQLKEKSLQEEIRSYKTLIERDAFILVLIDGDGMIFDDDLIKQGETGGKEAATSLSSSVRDYVHRTVPDLSSDYKIVTRIYANLKGLGDVCHKAGISTKPSTIEEFARGFTGSKHLFDFVDVGMGKDRADEKISEILKLHLYDVHCRHILFGCSHDNGYARLLEDVGDRKNMERITLLEGVPFERELASLGLKYRTTKFEGLFRTSKINVYASFTQPPLQHQLQSIASYQSPYQSTPSYPTQQNGYPQPTSPPTYTLPVSRTPAPTNGSTTKMNPAAPTWASAAISGPAQVTTPPPTPQQDPPVPRIDRNKFDQRIDSVLVYDKESVKKVRGLHLCVNHYLRECTYGDSCTNRHDANLSKNDLHTLKVVARQMPCKFGTGCDDPYCTYGHRCPMEREGSRECFFGADCRFPSDMHGIDLKIVRTTKVGK